MSTEYRVVNSRGDVHPRAAYRSQGEAEAQALASNTPINGRCKVQRREADTDDAWQDVATGGPVKWPSVFAPKSRAGIGTDPLARDPKG